MAQAVMVAESAPVMAAAAAPKVVDDESQKKNRIQVSNTKKPLFFYLNLAKRYIKQHNDVELSALGMAIPTVVTIAEILKANGVAVEKRVLTSTVGSKDESKGRLVQKAKIEIFLEKMEKLDIQQPAAETAKTESAESESKLDEAVCETKSEAPVLETTEKVAPELKSEASDSEAKAGSGEK